MAITIYVILRYYESHTTHTTQHMSKERRTVTLDPENDEYLDREGVNASELVNRLVEMHRRGNGDKRAMLELRREQIQSELSRLQGNVENRRDELERVEEQLREIKSEKEVVFEEADEILPEEVDVTHGGIKRFAKEAGMTPQEFLDELQEYR